ncbi:MAG: hypothetical protein ACPG5B_13370 [Chitinophagales bacterium]
MQTISASVMQEASDYINNSSYVQTEDFILYFGSSQPAILVYLMAAEHADLEQEERETLLFIGIKLWYATQITNPKLPIVTTDLLEKVIDNNLQMIAYFSGEAETNLEKQLSLVIDNHPQVEMLSFAINEVVDDETIRDDIKGGLFVHLKTIIEALDAVDK